MSKIWQRPTRRDALLQDREGAYAIARHVRMSPQKVRRVIDIVRGLPVKDALDILRFAPQAASEPVYKVIASAVANAESTENLRAADLYVSQIFVDEGTTMRRIRARAKGSASRILKRSSHITAVVEPLSGKGLGIPVSKQVVTKRFSELEESSKAKSAKESKPATPKAPEKAEATPAAKGGSAKVAKTTKGTAKKPAKAAEKVEEQVSEATITIADAVESTTEKEA